MRYVNVLLWTSVWYSGVGFHLKPKFHCAMIYHSVVKSFWDFVQSTITSKFGTLVLHINAKKNYAIRFSKSLLFIFSWFYVWKFRVNVSFNIVSRQIYNGTFRVETSRCRCRISLPGKHANIARSWDLSKTTACIHIQIVVYCPVCRRLLF